jgi:hypothetical protein
MSPTRLITLFFASVLFLGACSEQEEPPTPETEAANPLLSYVPADTPYVLANLEPVPEDVLDTYLARFQPVLDSIQYQMSLARNELESSEGGIDDNPGAKLVHALFLEMDGKLSRDGLESMGFDLQSRKVVYGLGAFPVIRMGLSDPEALRATILRVLGNAGITAPEQEFQGVSFWRVSDVDIEHEPAGLYVSILDDHLAMSIFPPMAEAELLPMFLGLEMPADSDALARLTQLNRTHDYTPHGSGIVDFHRLADQFLRPENVAARVLASTGNYDPASFSQECASEIHGIIGNTPKVTMGVSELTSSAVAMQYRVETPETLAGQLLGLVSKIPAAEQVSSRSLDFAFGMRFGPARDFLHEKLSGIAEQPYECEQLLHLNQKATEVLAQLDQPMPPFVNNFRGVRVSIDEFTPGQQPMPVNAKGHLAVHVEKPEMFVGMAQMFLPDLSDLAITPGDPPVELPESLLPSPGLVAFAAMSQDAIGLSVGENEEQGLPDFLDRDSGPKGTFLSANYDMAAYLDYTDAMGRNYQSHGNDHHQHAEAAREIREAATKAYREMADRSYVSLRFSSEGLLIDNRMTFK